MFITHKSITDGSTPPLVGTGHLLPWSSSSHMYPGDPSRRIKAKFGDDLEIERDMLAAKRSHEDNDTSRGESDGMSGTSASTESDADVVPEKRRRRRACRRPWRRRRRITHHVEVPTSSNCGTSSNIKFQTSNCNTGGKIVRYRKTPNETRSGCGARSRSIRMHVQIKRYI